MLGKADQITGTVATRSCFHLTPVSSVPFPADSIDIGPLAASGICSISLALRPMRFANHSPGNVSIVLLYDSTESL